MIAPKTLLLMGLLTAITISGCGIGPNLKDIKNFSGSGIEFQYPGNWTLKHDQSTNEILLEYGGIEIVGLSFIPYEPGTKNKQRLLEFERQQEGVKTPVERIILKKPTQGVRVESEIMVEGLKFETICEAFYAGKEHHTLFILLFTYKAQWSRELPGFELILNSLKQKDNN